MNNTSSKILIVFDPSRHHGFYDCIRHWIAREIPEHHNTFQFEPLPYRLPPGHDTQLLVAWLQDPLGYKSPGLLEQIKQLCLQCGDHQIRIFQHPQRLGNAAKEECCFLLTEANIRTPYAERLSHNFSHFKFPVLVREEHLHGSLMIRVENANELAAIPFDKFSQPTIVELHDLPQADGLYYKYRYLVSGSYGTPYHLQISQKWITRGNRRVHSSHTQVAELAYVNTPCPHHDTFIRASKALGLDTVAFDYSIDHDGTPIIWEANPFPDLRIAHDSRLDYRNHAIHRSHAMVVASYFNAAKIDMPQKLIDYICFNPIIKYTKT